MAVSPLLLRVEFWGVGHASSLFLILYCILDIFILYTTCLNKGSYLILFSAIFGGWNTKVLIQSEGVGQGFLSKRPSPFYYFDQSLRFGFIS